ncbi:MAG: hypothetical protein ACTJLK_04080 [Anaplasma sp.]
MSHKICGTGSGTEKDVTASTNCRSGAPAPKGSDNDVAGLGIGSEDVKDASGASGKALTKDMYDTLVKAFEANDASTAGTDTNKYGCAVKAGNAFDGTLSSSKTSCRSSVVFTRACEALPPCRASGQSPQLATCTLR